MTKHIILSLSLIVAIILSAPFAYGADDEEEKARKANEKRIERALEFFNEEGYEEAISLLKKVRGRYARTAEVQYYLGLSYKALEEYNMAIEHLERAAKRSSELPNIHLHIAQSQFFSGKYDKALRTTAQAIKSSDNPGEAFFLKAIILFRKADYSTAIREFDRASEASDHLKYQAEYYKAVSYVNLNKFDQAIESYKNVMQLAPDSDLAAFAEQEMRGLKVPERKFNATISVRYETDDNVYMLPSESDYEFTVDGLTPGTVLFDDEDRKDERVAANLDINYKLVRGEKGGINLTYSLFTTDHDTASELDLKVNRAVFTPYVSNKKVGFTLPIVYEHVELNNRRYLDVISVTPTVNGKIFKDSMLSFYVKARKNEYRDSPKVLHLPKEQDRDGVLTLGGLSYYSFSRDKRGYFNVGFEGQRELTEGKDWEYLGGKGYINILIPFRENTTFGFGGYTQKIVYEKEDSIFLRRHHNTTFSYYAKFKTQMSKRFDFVLSYNSIDRESNIDFYTSKKAVISGGLDFRF